MSSEIGDLKLLQTFAVDFNFNICVVNINRIPMERSRSVIIEKNSGRVVNVKRKIEEYD